MKIDVRKIAENRNITVIERLLTDSKRGAAFKKEGRWYITVNKLDTPERKNFTIAHELAEIELYDREDITIDEKHRLSNTMASDMLLPEEQFKNDSKTLDLFQLKEMYPHASYEVIARKALKYKNSVLTIIDNRQKTLRAGSEGLAFQQNLMPFEKDIIEMCYKNKDKVTESNFEARCESYYIDEGRGVERVILFTEPNFLTDS